MTHGEPAAAGSGTVLPRGRRAAVVFYVVCAACLPAMAVGYVLWLTKLYASRGSSSSGTAQGPLSARWMQHRLGIRPDEAAYRLMLNLPTVSPAAVWLLFGPMLLAHRVTGHVPAPFRYPFEGRMTMRNQASARQTFYDAVVERHVAEVRQLVILGAGFDTRALRMAPPGRVRSFEVDMPATLATKQAALRKAKVDLSLVTFVPADFDHDDWFEALCAAGFDPAQSSLFIWEGVTPYLERTTVEQALERIGRCGDGSILAFDYVTATVLESRSVSLRVVRASVRAAGEPFTFGVDATPPAGQRLAELLGPHGLVVTRHEIVGEASRRRPWLGGFVVAAIVRGHNGVGGGR